MSSEYWVEPCPRGQTGVKGPEEGTGKGAEDAELICGDDQGDTEESGGGEDPESPVHSRSQEVTHEGGVGQVQAEEKCPEERRNKLAQRSEERGTERLDGGPGVCGERWEAPICLCLFQMINDLENQQSGIYSTL